MSEAARRYIGTDQELRAREVVALERASEAFVFLAKNWSMLACTLGILVEVVTDSMREEPKALGSEEKDA